MKVKKIKSNDWQDINKESISFTISLEYRNHTLYMYEEDNNYLYSPLNKYISSKFYSIHSYYTPKIYFIMKSSECDDFKNKIRNEIYLKFSEYIDNVIEEINNYKNIVVDKLNEKINNYNKKYNIIVQDINEKLLKKYENFIIIDGIKNIEKYKNSKEKDILKYDNIIKEYKELSNFCKYHIRNQKLNKLIDGF